MKPASSPRLCRLDFFLLQPPAAFALSSDDALFMRPPRAGVGSMGLVEHCLCAECDYALHVTGLSSYFNRGNAMLTHLSSLSFLIGTLLAKHTQSPLPVRLSPYQLLDAIFILLASSMQEHPHRVGPGYCNGVRPLVHIYFHIGLLSHRPNNVGPYYLQVNTSSVNGVLPDVSCLTSWQLQDISSSDHHSCRRRSDLCKSPSTNNVRRRYEITLQDWAVPFPPGTLVGSNSLLFSIQVTIWTRSIRYAWCGYFPSPRALSK
jgi:hypothetical protein